MQPLGDPCVNGRYQDVTCHNFVTVKTLEILGKSWKNKIPLQGWHFWSLLKMITAFKWDFLVHHQFMSSICSETKLSSSFWGYLNKTLTIYSLCAKDCKDWIVPQGGLVSPLLLLTSICHFPLYTSAISKLWSVVANLHTPGVSRVLEQEEKALILAKLLKSFHFLI